MASHTYEQLKGMVVAELREIAQGIKDDALEGYSTLHKEQLLPLLCKVLKIPMHHTAAGVEKIRLKMAIHKIQARHSQASTKKDQARGAMDRRMIHSLKRRLRQMAKAADAAPKPAPAESKTA
jgi:hypothetical protein